jgi:hypothetical protein
VFCLASASCDGRQSKNCRETSTWSSDGVALLGQDTKPSSDAQHIISSFDLFIDIKHGKTLYVAGTDNHRIQTMAMEREMLPVN